MLWRGDFHNAQQLLQAMARRIDNRTARHAGRAAEAGAVAFHRYRMQRAQRARTLGMLLLPFDADHRIALSRAPDVSAACREAHGEGDAPYVASLRELLGIIGAHEWRKRGIEVSAIGARIHPHYGVFAPIRSEYVDLVARAPLGPVVPQIAFDIGTGTGVLAAVLARRGIARVVATDNDPRALACARDNVHRLSLADVVDVQQANLFPPDREAQLVVCNPPWLPGRPGSSLDKAIYDAGQQMLRGFIEGLPAHLADGGEGWLLLSDLAEHLGLRTRTELLAMFAAARLDVIGRLEARPSHPRVRDQSDPLHAARAAEVTSLWRLARRAGEGAA